MVYTSKHPNADIPTNPSLYHFLFLDNPKKISDDKLCYLDTEDPKTSYNYGQMKSQILKAAAGLKREFGFNKGDIVAICSPNDVDYPVILHGAVVAGGACATIDHEADVKLIAHDLNVVQAKVVVTHKDNYAKVLEACACAHLPKTNVVVFGDAAVGGLRTVHDTLLSKQELAEPMTFTADQLANDPAFLYFTSGTTGDKKAVIITQRIVMANLAIKKEWPFDDINILAYTEFHHASSLLTAMNFAFQNGATVYVMPHYTLRRFCEALEKYSIHLTNTQPYIIAALTKEKVAEEYDLSSLSYAICCGAALDHSVTLAAKEKIGLRVFDIYGMTEVLCIFEADADLTEKHSIGEIAPHFQVKLVDEEGKEVPTGEMGELCVKGPTVTKGYYRNPEATAKSIDKEGWFHTGDLVKCDENGYFYYVDRAKDMIKYYLVQIFPSDIESVLITHPKVADCAVIGLYQKELTTEYVTAYVTLVEGEKPSKELEQELRAYCDSRLDDDKHIRGGVHIIPEFPRTPSGKIQRRILKEKALKGELSL
ncbi:hypothetical protein BDF20DRAFT_918033 [Mycotypha africana]|uniref:uncharacterized protein n=1 Tax=Mycotypha africana TaxID=64632 RepID=UPI0023005A32|nr:uncharacterized protein BDF20DRAFT_918033 [Mycotypha africana]KAI8966949.1 hypothetical protein BDF20DRAFT_918033 [Mycotypha africana]